MASEVRFEPGLYRGAAGYYERFRLPYPAAMIADLARRAALSGHGRLLDLACGTGQLAFPLRGWFAEVWAVDAEPGMTEVVRAKAAARRRTQPVHGRRPARRNGQLRLRTCPQPSSRVIAARFMIMDSFGRHVAISVHDHETDCHRTRLP